VAVVRTIGASDLIVFMARLSESVWFWGFPSIETHFPPARSTECDRAYEERGGETMQWLMRIVCIGYFVFLTMLLLTADPARLIGLHGGLLRIVQVVLPWAHAISFMVLAVLALMTRWPIPRWGIVLALVIYAGMTEIVQGYVPHRTPDWIDWLQDLAGIALGAACCWGVATLAATLVPARRSPEHTASAPSDEWAVMRKLFQRSAVSERSWWS
jgi:hypothetical protein